MKIFDNTAALHTFEREKYTDGVDRNATEEHWLSSSCMHTARVDDGKLNGSN